ncbi:hypothetical protein FEDK69T_14110 [Flavobacterium enshiense DK69]|uniref:T9SS sorting signal type C domain-containing protein n=1 Tax=Flavobacterium enshiense TaxID=1341165 RepID=UPI0003C58F14|nr:T9SS sorting signal type C domain-containing protein [Flavobacterium enshiense]ESU23257.1 hypothetical protein FEDK69T_14110 [Flavobacterium enshiense DK69]
MTKNLLLLSIFTLLISLSAFATQKTFNGSVSTNWSDPNNWNTTGIPTSSDDVIIPQGITVDIDVDAFAKSVTIHGILNLTGTKRLTVGSSSVNGNFTVKSTGEFNITQSGTLIVYGNYTNEGKTNFWKGDVIITGNLSSPAISAIQNQGNVIVGGNIIGNINLTGGQGTNQIYPMNPNATVITDIETANPGAPISGENSTLIDLINTVILGGTCPFTANAPSDSGPVCEGSNTTFTVLTGVSGATYQWQINNGTGWKDLTTADTAYSGINTLALTINAVTMTMNGYQYRLKITSGGCAKNGHFGELTVTAALSQPTLSSVTQPTCTVSTGSFTITNYDASYAYTIAPAGATITGANVTAPTGTYTVTASLGSCTSPVSSSVTVNAQPVTPAQPTLGSVTQPTCTVSTGSFTITNYNATYTYAFSPSTGVSNSAGIVTAPAGTYTVTATLGTCTSPASSSVTISPINTNTWNGTEWSSGSAPTGTEIIVFNGDYNLPTDISACSCQIVSGNVVIRQGHTLTVTDKITVTGGSLTFEDDSSLLQTNDVANIGNITYKRKTTPLKKYDYTYWSAPVADATLSQLATNSLFYAYDPTISNVASQCWVRKYGNNIMAPGLGYIGRAPGTYTSPQVVETSFAGIPNNGIITTPIKRGTGTLNLIGNPYPSAINIDLFLTDPANKDIVNGTIYLWTHNTPISSNTQGDWTYNYDVNDYAKYNLTGGVGTGSQALSGGGIVPTGKVAAGQGFFIDANPALNNNTTYWATFKNNMRVQGDNNQFFRNGENGNNTNTTPIALEKHRVWISLSNTQGKYNEALVGYIQEATNGLDRLFDGKTLPSENVISIYSLLSNEKLSIQGRSLPFQTTDIVPIGYTTSVSGDLTVNLENFDGLFANQDIYLLDKTTGIYHDLKAGSFTFTTTSGTFNDRFELRFNRGTLGVNTVDNNNTDIRIITKAQHLSVLSGASSISSIEVRDLLGKLVFSKKGIHSNEFDTDAIPATSQMLIVKVTLEDQKTVTRKVLMP